MPPTTVALLSTGSLNPPTRAHVLVLAEARRHLESLGYEVVRGYLSPSHDAYVASKARALKTNAADAAQRAEMCRIAVRDLGQGEWIRVSEWETEQDEFLDFPEVAEHFRQTEDADLLVYVCGSDHARTCGLQNGLPTGMPGIGLLVLERPGHAFVPARGRPHVFLARSEVELGEVSSTRARALLTSGKDASDLLTPGCVEYLASGEGAGLYARPVFISLSSIIARFVRLDTHAVGELEKGLFFFGSKRCWVFPETDWQRAEARVQPGGYAGMPPALREMVARKEARGEVCFLKPDVPGIADIEVFGDYKRASDWLVGLGYVPLKLDPAEWEEDEAWVVENFRDGLHDYDAVVELLEASEPRLKCVLRI
ncbi:hypothetical protein DFJ74DRAFT_704437 [Hyaloraphidium curvatum]|nr:hypothetical protein DFJ74DRAFT_704437 [Hyaloraphidium curvatum]